MVQHLQGISYEVCSTNIDKFFGTPIIYFSFCDASLYTSSLLLWYWDLPDLSIRFEIFGHTKSHGSKF